MATTKKITAVSEMTDKVKKAKAIVFAEYRGLKHKQLEELRRAVKKADGEIMVTKNTLFLRALGDKANDVKENMKEATMTLFSYKDEVSPLKTMMAFFKTAGAGKSKGGLLGSTVMNEKEVLALSILPSKETLLGRLAGQLKAPITGLHYALSWNMNRLVWALTAVNGKKA